MRRVSVWTLVYAIPLLCVELSINATAQTFSTLVNFDGTNGNEPIAALAQGIDGSLYGTTVMGGNNCGTAAYCGTAFKVTPSGNLTTLYEFCSQANCSDGEQPGAPMILSKDGNFYGTTTFGGVNGQYGTIFKLTPAGKLTTIYEFCLQANCPDGAVLYSGLTQGADGNFYGTTNEGGDPTCSCGTVFKITPTAKLTTLYTFHLTDGAQPFAGLIQAKDGNFYGTTVYGGANGYGTLFKINSKGTLTTLYNFCAQTNCADGATPAGSLVQAVDGTFYGLTGGGGTGGGNGFGTLFAMNSGGVLTTLHSFGSNDGFFPSWLVLASDGNLYGTTEMGADFNDGIVFESTPQGSVTVLHSFNGSDGRYPRGLVQATDGSFYGVTNEGGAGNGTVFNLSVGLGPFVKAITAGAKVGAEVGILGNNLTGATHVSFNGTQAQFTVHSASLILTRVPTGATTGTINVTLPSGTLSSSVPFYVLK